MLLGKHKYIDSLHVLKRVNAVENQPRYQCSSTSRTEENIEKICFLIQSTSEKFRFRSKKSSGTFILKLLTLIKKILASSRDVI